MRESTQSIVECYELEDKEAGYFMLFLELEKIGSKQIMRVVWILIVDQ